MQIQLSNTVATLDLFPLNPLRYRLEVCPLTPLLPAGRHEQKNTATKERLVIDEYPICIEKARLVMGATGLHGAALLRHLVESFGLTAVIGG
jgi:hypothetical protein